MKKKMKKMKMKMKKLRNSTNESLKFDSNNILPS